MEDKDDVGHSYWERLKPGDSLNVYYLPQRPSHSRLWLGTRWFLPLVFFLVGAPMTFVGGVIEFMIVAELRRKHVKHTPSLRQMSAG